MKNVRHLITAGCSFTQYPNKDISWAYHLSQYLGCDTVYKGQGAAGNAIISRHAIYQTVEALKKYKPEEILVGVMWSGPERWTVYYDENPPTDHYSIECNSDYWANPVKITSNQRNFYMINPGFDDSLSQNHYRYFSNKAGGVIETIEHILRTQWFFQKHNIPYFMSTYLNEVLPAVDNMPWLYNNPDIKFLLDLIDQSTFLKISDIGDRNDCFSWCLHESGKNFRALHEDHHPSTEQHIEFTNRIIIPHLLKNNMVYDVVDQNNLP